MNISIEAKRILKESENGLSPSFLPAATWETLRT